MLYFNALAISAALPTLENGPETLSDAAGSKQELICQIDLSSTSYVLQVPVNKPQLEKDSPVLRALLRKGGVDVEYGSRTSSISSRKLSLILYSDGLIQLCKSL